MITKAEFQKLLERAAAMKRQYPSWRMGQCYSNAWNEVCTNSPSLIPSDAIVLGEIDPFNDDSKIGEFLAFIWNFHVDEDQ
jgi:hypothetical protein